MAYEMGNLPESALSHVTEGQEQPGLLASGTAGATQPPKVIANVGLDPARKGAMRAFDLRQHERL
jgi:hypothetical protein